MPKEQTQDQVYFTNILNKFNENSNHDELTNIEKILLKKIIETNQKLEIMSKELNELNKDIDQKKIQASGLLENMLKVQGQSQGCVDSLLALKNSDSEDGPE